MQKRTFIFFGATAALTLITVGFFLFTPKYAAESNDQFLVDAVETEDGFAFIDPKTGTPIEEISSAGGTDGEWVSLSRTSENVPVLLSVQQGLPDQVDTDQVVTDQWWEEAKIKANTPTDHSLTPGESSQSREITYFSGTNIHPADFRPKSASITTPTTVTFVVHHSNAHTQKFNYYELWRVGTRILLSESPVLHDSGLTPGELYEYRIVGSHTPPDTAISGSSESLQSTVFLRTPDSDLDTVIATSTVVSP